MATNDNVAGYTDQDAAPDQQATRLYPELTTITLAVGESMQIRMRDMRDEQVSKLYWSTSEREHVQVDPGGIITAVNPGQATITIKTEQGSRNAAKVKVYVIPDSLCYSSFAARLLPTAISDDIREILRNDFNIIDNESFIRNYRDMLQRRSYQICSCSVKKCSERARSC